ncbi:hypothetical protein [uncultured Gammaproteobacteria bacterium]|nr:hypothetical protein [uncultured Gammaproteobacteria bacterium]
MWCLQSKHNLHSLLKFPKFLVFRTDKAQSKLKTALFMQ